MYCCVLDGNKIYHYRHLTLQCASVTEIGRSYQELDESEYNYIRINGTFCDLSHLGQWEDAGNCQRFYTCEVNPKPSPYCDTEYGQTKSSDHLVRLTYV